MRVRHAAIGLLAMLGAPPLLAAAASSQPSVPAAPPESVASVAGPGYCDTTGRRDATAATVRSLAVDTAGDVFFDTGPPAAGLVARVAPDGSVSTLSTGVPSGRPPAAPTTVPGLIPSPGRLAADGTGGVLIAAGARVVDVDPSSGLSTIAGDPTGVGDSDGSGSAGDGGAAANARFARAASLATDEAGNVFIADVSGGGDALSVVRFLNRGTRSITFFGGTPGAITVEPGAMARIAGAVSHHTTAEPGSTPVTSLGAYLPGAAPVMAVAGDRLYIAVSAPDPRRARLLLVDLGSEPVRGLGVMVEPGQIVAVGGADSGPTKATAFPLATVTGIAATDDGRVYLAEESHHRVLQADAAGDLTVIAGRSGGAQSDAGFDGNGQVAVGTRLDRPFDVKRGGGRIYIADQGNDEVRAVDNDGVIRAVAGGGVANRWVCSGSPGSGVFGSAGAPTGVAVADSGVVYVALPALNRVQRINLAGLVTTIAGGGGGGAGCRGDPLCAGFSGDGGPANGARLDRPTAVALASEDELYILDAGNARVRLVNLGTAAIEAHGVTINAGAIATVAGTGVAGFDGNGGRATHARILGAPGYARRAVSIASQLDDPRAYVLGSMAAGRDGDVFLAGDRTVRRIDAAGWITSVTAPAEPDSGRCCTDPVAVAEDGAGNLFIADRGTDSAGALHSRIWVMNRTGHSETVLGVPVERGATVVVAGDGAFGSDGDGGPALQASLEAPIAIAVAAHSGRLFVAEAGKSSGGGVRLSDVRQIDTAGTITTIVGGGAAAFNGDGLPPPLTDLDLPSGVAADRCGNLLIADTGSDRVRRVLLTGDCAPLGEAASQGGGLPLAPLLGVIGTMGFIGVATTWLRVRTRKRAARSRGSAGGH